MLRHDGAGGAGGLRGGRLPPKNVGFGAVTVMVHVQVSTAEQNQATGRRKSRPLSGASGERREGVARPEFPACSVGHF
ncbi:hypothetical protein CHELA20_11219 [Hyphomicrobiales bacterium]|nr:hypothetical protein CHELA20_11219 [Hyphomicrobiales bacterium]